MAHRTFELARKGFNVSISIVWPQVKCPLTCSAFELKAVDFYTKLNTKDLYLPSTFAFFDTEMKRKLTRFQIISYIFILIFITK